MYDKLKLYNRATPLYLKARNVRHLKLGNNAPEYSATLVRLVHVYKAVRYLLGKGGGGVWGGGGGGGGGQRVEVCGRAGLMTWVRRVWCGFQLEKETAIDWKALDKADRSTLK